LIFPFRRNRSAGFGMMHSSEALPNFLAVWLSCLLIFWNLRATAAAPIPQFNLLQLLLYAGILPVCACVLIGRALRRKPEPGRAPADAGPANGETQGTGAA